MTKRLLITVEGKTYEVQVEILAEGNTGSATAQAASAPVTSSAISAPTPLAKSTNKATVAGDIPSPLAGKVVSVDCTVGQMITEGQKILTLEAMKMNTVVTAPSSGKVAAIKVGVGDAVEEGQPLITLV